MSPKPKAKAPVMSWCELVRPTEAERNWVPVPWTLATMQKAIRAAIAAGAPPESEILTEIQENSPTYAKTSARFYARWVK